MDAGNRRLGLASGDAGLANFPIPGLHCHIVGCTKREFVAKSEFAASNPLSISVIFSVDKGTYSGVNHVYYGLFHSTEITAERPGLAYSIQRRLARETRRSTGKENIGFH